MHLNLLFRERIHRLHQTAEGAYRMKILQTPELAPVRLAAWRSHVLGEWGEFRTVLGCL